MQLLGYMAQDCVSILVLMDSRIKILLSACGTRTYHRGFNPCFNGQQDKNSGNQLRYIYLIDVSILVLMDSRIKIPQVDPKQSLISGFNPCFNGQQDKNLLFCNFYIPEALVSILVLMDSRIKMDLSSRYKIFKTLFQSLF